MSYISSQSTHTVQRKNDRKNPRMVMFFGLENIKRNIRAYLGDCCPEIFELFLVEILIVGDTTYDLCPECQCGVKLFDCDGLQ